MLTEQQLRAKLVATMTGWVGYSETNGRYKAIIDLYNSHKPLARGYVVKYTDEWCATTIGAAAIKCGVTDIMPTECSCSKMIELYKALGRWQESDAYTPQPGDLVLWDWQDTGVGDNNGAPDHIGMVTFVSAGKVTCIEGNKGESVTYRSFNINGRFIRGYCTPDYASKAKGNTPKTTKITVSVLEQGHCCDAVTSLQQLLAAKGFYTTSVDGDFGPKTKGAVEKFQRNNKLPVDGVCGAATWTKLLGL